MVAQTGVETLVKGGTCGVRANVAVDSKQVKGFSADRVIKLTNESVTGDQDGRGAARPMAVVQGADGDAGSVSTNARMGQNIKSSDGGGGIISRMSLGKYDSINFFQPHHHLGSGELRRVRGARFASRVPGADSEAMLLQRYGRRVS